jgi:glucokinase
MWVIGVDLGGTKTDIGLIAPDNSIPARRRIATESEKGAESVVERIAEVVESFKGQVPLDEKISALGICTPGPVDHVNGELLTLVNLPGLSNTPLRALLAERLGIPVRLEHDAKAAALGDFHYGAGKHVHSMTYTTIGTGVGAAIILNNQLYYGDGNAAGEVGHITIDRYGEACQCGTRGCVETYMSGPWMAKRYERAIVNAGQAPKQPITGELVAQLAEKGDTTARYIVTEAGEALGIAIASMAMLFDIELNVIGGSVVKLGDLLLEPARRTMPEYCFRALGERIKIMPTALGINGPLLGCAWLARQATRAT